MEVVNNNNQEEILIGSNEYLHVVKGKRTKRQRPLSPLTLPAMTTSTSSSGGGGGGGDEQQRDNNFPSPTTSVEFSGISSEEEEDMANCLILLAQGGHKRSKQINDHVDDENGKMARINSRRFYNDAAATTSKEAGAGAGLYLYECKTCNKCFSSFQALGGHRASHKRPNKGMCNEETKMTITKTSSLLMLTEQESPQHHQFNDNSNNNNNIASTTCARPSLVLQMGNSSSVSTFNNNKSRVHECSICGSEFSSGQALGGHMRRHRTSNTTMATTTTTRTNIDFSHHQDELNFSNKKAARNVLSLDLNLPAPPEEDYSSKFSLFSSSKQQPQQQQPLVFSASALVDCHY
ncbi:hypothetical protein MKX01_027342 [Papaver californicum]|nr:hypothetical protein MKX01_027342 [Papaver californicum]